MADHADTIRDVLDWAPSEEEARGLAALDALVAERDEARAEVERLRGALECAIRAAWDGPAEWVGSDCAESYSQWRERMERTARAALTPPAIQAHPNDYSGTAAHPEQEEPTWADGILHPERSRKMTPEEQDAYSAVLDRLFMPAHPERAHDGGPLAPCAGCGHAQHEGHCPERLGGDACGCRARLPPAHPEPAVRYPLSALCECATGRCVLHPEPAAGRGEVWCRDCGHEHAIGRRCTAEFSDGQQCICWGIPPGGTP